MHYPKLQKNLEGIDLSKVLLGAIDISKDEHHGYCFTLDGQEDKVIKFTNDHHGANQYWDYLEKNRKSKNLEQIVVTAESTGTYGEGILNWYVNKGAKVLLVNPKHTKRLKELTDNSPNKTDKKDPRVIGSVLTWGGGYQPMILEDSIAELRNLSHNRERQKKSVGRLYNQLESQVVRIFPEFLKVMKGLKTKTAKGILKLYPIPQELLQISKITLGEKMQKLSRGRLNKERASELYLAASKSIGITRGTSSISLEIKTLVENITNMEDQIKRIEKQMHKELEKIPWSKYLLSIPGVSIISASILIGEIGDFKKFRNAQAIEKLSGLNLYEISSGKHIGRKKVSKRGRVLLRKILYMVSLGMVKKNGIFRSIYEKHKEKGMKSPQAIVAVSRKLIRVIYALVIKEEEYKTQT